MKNKYSWMQERYQELYLLCRLWPKIPCGVVLSYCVSYRLQNKYREDLIEELYY